MNDPIPGEYLRTCLIELVPKDKDFSLKERIKWDNKIDSLVSCYEEYVNTVCGEALDAVKDQERALPVGAPCPTGTFLMTPTVVYLRLDRFSSCCSTSSV